MRSENTASSREEKDFFISYAQADLEWAGWIAWQLEKAGYTSILRGWDFRPGMTIAVEIDRAVKLAKRTIIVLSPDYLNALEQQAEWAPAFMKDQAGRQGRLLPIRVKRCDPTGLLGSIVPIDLVGLDEQAVQKALLEGLSLARAKPSQAPRFPGASRSPQTASDGEQPFPGSPAQKANKSWSVFISYARKDEKLRDELETHLSILRRQNIITTWYDRDIDAGEEWKTALDYHVETADIILLLISPSFMASDYCYEYELMRAMERHKAGEALVIPIILRPTDDWKSAPFGVIQGLPRDGKPITTWSNRDEAFVDVARGIRGAIKKLQTRQ